MATRFLSAHLRAWTGVPPVTASFDKDAKIVTARLVIRHPYLIRGVIL
jgi:hypothetical protein